MKFLKKKKAIRNAVMALLVVPFLWLVLWLAAPAVLKSQIQRLGSEKLGRSVTLKAVDFRPWTLELFLHDLRIDGLAGAENPLLSVKRIYLDLELQSLFRLAPVLNALEVDEPVLHLAQTGAGRYDVDDILQRLAKPGKSDEPLPRFALYNIALRDGAVDFRDATVARTHQLRGLTLSLPFLSNLASAHKAVVEPRLAFELNGSAFDSSALSTPFLATHATDLRLAFKGLDLENYLDYIPEALPVQITSGLLDVDLEIAFEQTDQAQVRMHGQVALNQAQLRDARNQELLQFERLAVKLRDFQPLRQQLLLDSVVLTRPQLVVRRDAKGVINWLALAGSGQGAEAVRAQPASAGVPASSAWRVEVAQLKLEQGRAQWHDLSADAAAQGAHLLFDDMGLQANALAWPMTQPLQFNGSLTLASAGAAPAKGALAFSGQTTATQGQLGARLASLPIALGAPYLSAHFKPEVKGLATAEFGVGWNGAATVVKVARLALDSLSLQDRAAPARIQQVLLEDADIYLHSQQLRVGQLSLNQPEISVQRDAKGRWMYEPWLAVPKTKALASSAAQPQRPWGLLLDKLVINGGQVSFLDALPVRPVQWQASGLTLKIRDFAPLAQTAKASAVQLSTRLASGRRAQLGSLAYDGSLSLAPLLAEGAIRASDLPLQAFEPYVADRLNVRVLRADGSFSGRLRYEDAKSGSRLSLQGDAQLSDLRARAQADSGTAVQTLARGEDLLHWKQLALRGLNLAMAPGLATVVSVRETALSDFYARVIVQANGRINLQDIVKPSSAAPTEEVAEQGAEVQGLAPQVHIGPVVLTGGTVAFSDYFVQPHYSADLSALAGRLSAFSSVPAADQQAPQMADLELRGRAQGTANLEILGKLNPLAKPLALDITARMRDLELSPLTPYAIKYAGHGIERGKLSLDVNYRLQPDGQLTASNKLVLNQLTFGEAVEGAPASLPVKLATALLADSNGVIDLDLPISGSLNDPQFRLAPVIFKVLGNLIMKAVTAPFALLSGAFGSDGDSGGAVFFAPGSAQLDAAGQQSLDKIAKALQQRPALQMTVVGEALLAAEREGWKLQQLQQMLLAEKRRKALRAGESADSVIAIEPAEASALLKAVYRRADIAKPRNFVGMAKDLPDSEMQTLLLVHIPVPDNAMRDLAQARAVAVRDYLAAQKLPLQQLFLGAPAQPPAAADWKPQARLNLAVR